MNTATPWKDEQGETAESEKQLPFWEKEGPLHPFNLISSPQDGAPGNNLLSRRTLPEMSPSRGNLQRTRSQSLSTSRPENPFLSHWLTTMPGKSRRGDRKSPQEFPTDSGRLVSRAQTQARRQQGPTRPNERSPGGSQLSFPESAPGMCDKDASVLIHPGHILIKGCVQNAGRREEQAGSC